MNKPMNNITTTKLSAGQYLAVVDTPNGDSFEVTITDLRPLYDIKKWKIELTSPGVYAIGGINTYYDTRRDCLLVLTHSFNPSNHIQ